MGCATGLARVDQYSAIHSVDARAPAEPRAPYQVRVSAAPSHLPALQCGAPDRSATFPGHESVHRSRGGGGLSHAGQHGVRSGGPRGQTPAPECGRLERHDPKGRQKNCSLYRLKGLEGVCLHRTLSATPGPNTIRTEHAAVRLLVRTLGTWVVCAMPIGFNCARFISYCARRHGRLQGSVPRAMPGGRETPAMSGHRRAAAG